MAKSKRSLRIASLAVLASLAMTVVPFLSSTQVSAQPTGLLIIYGYVTDQAGRPMEGIPVVVVAMNGETPRATKSTTTDEFGFYQVTFAGFPASEWDIGDKIIATAQVGEAQASNDYTIIDETPMIELDIQFPFEIPEFGTLLGFAATAAAIGAMAILLLKRRNTIKK